MLKIFHADRIDLEPADFEGNAMDAWVRTLHVTPGDTVAAGVFEGRSGYFEFEYGHDEVVYITAGSYRLEDLESGQAITAEAGDLVIIPKGIRLRATIVEPLRCVYVTVPAWTE